MFGIAMHPPSLISLMIDRERFVPVMVPANFGKNTQQQLEVLFSRKPPSGTRRLLLVEGVATLNKLAALFPEMKVRTILFDVVDNLQLVTDLLIDIQSPESKRLVAIKATALNRALVKMKPIALEDFRQDFVPGEAVEIAKRDGKLLNILKGSSPSFQVTALNYILGIGTFAAVKRAGRREKPRVAKVQAYADSDEGMALIYAFMDMAFYGTESKVAALFANADLDDLRHAASLIQPETDIDFKFDIPDKLKLARE